MQACDNAWDRLLGSLCRVRVVWDEENLHQLETTKSPKQKITEPKTPYYALDDGGHSPTPDDERLQMDSASHAEAVRHALSEVATDDRASSSRASGSGSGSGSSWHYSEDELDGMETDGGSGSDGNHSGSFEEHRRKHYDNEYKKAKILLATDPALAVEDEDAAANGEAECSSMAVAVAK
ncbi:hypothetical protein M758_11G097400 [Ceratodon purpureus]|uniref:Uncharacterized protein n=1 Tax=Ceratodon purpureus TaxID=3225 RepID=A0A8T0GCG1_CERPU|nr:hypothetical protein KC19_11G100600 [Ceratodon purpureus]KAG0557078.1 hypothetical protein KC19_11G100600 [Ceratodon purpureus]KAG0601264.1 hypothetical protein M758_11G097400 [Ceratodon purpureus]